MYNSAMMIGVNVTDINANGNFTELFLFNDRDICDLDEVNQMIYRSRCIENIHIFVPRHV